MSFDRFSLTDLLLTTRKVKIFFEETQSYTSVFWFRVIKIFKDFLDKIIQSDNLCRSELPGKQKPGINHFQNRVLEKNPAFGRNYKLN